MYRLENLLRTTSLTHSAAEISGEWRQSKKVLFLIKSYQLYILENLETMDIDAREA